MGNMQKVLEIATKYYNSHANWEHFCGSMGIGCTYWCAAFVSVVFKEAGVDFPYNTRCTLQCAAWKEQDRLRTSNFKNIKVGDIIYYDWDYSGDADHVGIVVSKSGDTLKVIEGNYGDADPSVTQVDMRTISTSYAFIIASATPAYDSVSYTATGGGASGDEFLLDEDATTLEEELDLSEYIVALEEELEAMLNEQTKSMEYLDIVDKFYGSPFRFLETADPPVILDDEDTKRGRTYTKHIAMEAPLIHFVPGLPSYLSTMSKSNMEVFKEYVTERSKDAGGEISEEAMSKITGIEGRYFNFVPAFHEYQKYLNLLCRTTAMYLGIADKTVPGTDIKYKDYNYGNWQDRGINDTGVDAYDRDNTFGIFDTTNTEGKDEDGRDSVGTASAFEELIDSIEDITKNTIRDIFGGAKSVKYYVDPSTSFSESVSNQTGTSQVASLFDTGESLAKELKFWTSGNKLSSAAGSVTDSVTGAVDALASGVLSMVGMGSTPLTNIANYANYIISGSNIIFPEMWQDSSYSKSYGCTFNFVSPYGDPESIFINELLPLMSILAMALPRQTSANSFTSPMFVRVFSKGWFSCDLGVIGSVSIEKGGSDAWSASGLPLSMKVTVDIHDLYTTLAIPSTSQMGLFFNNDSLIEFLGATCGVDLLKPNIVLKASTAINGLTNMVTDIPTNTYERIVSFFNNNVMKHSGLIK